MSKKLTIDEVRKQVYEIAGYIVLDTIYVNSQTKMTGIDEYGYKYYFTLGNIKFAKAARRVDKSNPYSIENIKLFLELNDLPYELLSTEYHGNGSKNREGQLLKLKCKAEGHILYRTWNDISSGHIQCVDCAKRYTNHDEFVEYIENKYHGEYKILGQYINSQTKIKILHVKCGNIFYATPNSLANGHGCPMPKCCKKRGKEHYRYNENITDEERMMSRDMNMEYRIWRNGVYQNNNYTCDVCGNTRQCGNRVVAHHLYAWGEYPDKRLDISNGIVMCEDCHKEFHKIYGYGKNTPEQYYEYKNNYGNTEATQLIA